MPDTTTTPATITTVFGGLETLVTNALGDNESAVVKARVHALVTTLGALGTVLEPMLADHVDVQGLVDGIQKVEDGAVAIETGVADVVAAIKGGLHKDADDASKDKKDTTPSASSGSASASGTAFVGTTSGATVTGLPKVG